MTCVMLYAQSPVAVVWNRLDLLQGACQCYPWPVPLCGCMWLSQGTCCPCANVPIGAIMTQLAEGATPNAVVLSLSLTQTAGYRPAMSQ